MKRIFIFIFIFIYQFSLVSGKVYIHYCDSEISNISLVYNTEYQCLECNKNQNPNEKKFSCCKDEVHQLISASQHLVQKTELQSTSFKIFYYPSFSIYHDFFLSKKSFVNNNIDNHPNIVNQAPIFIRFRNITI